MGIFAALSVNRLSCSWQEKSKPAPFVRRGGRKECATRLRCTSQGTRDDNQSQSAGGTPVLRTPSRRHKEGARSGARQLKDEIVEWYPRVRGAAFVKH